MAEEIRASSPLPHRLSLFDVPAGDDGAFVSARRARPDREAPVLRARYRAHTPVAPVRCPDLHVGPLSLGASLCQVALRRANRQPRSSRHILSQKGNIGGLAGRPQVSDFIVRRELAGYALADRIIAPSIHVVESFAPWPDCTAKLVLNPLGVDLALFPMRETSKAERPTVIFVDNGLIARALTCSPPQSGSCHRSNWSTWGLWTMRPSRTSRNSNITTMCRRPTSLTITPQRISLCLRRGKMDLAWSCPRRSPAASGSSAPAAPAARTSPGWPASRASSRSFRQTNPAPCVMQSPESCGIEQPLRFAHRRCRRDRLGGEPMASGRSTSCGRMCPMIG